MITPFDPCPPDAEWRLVTLNDHYEISEYGHLRRAVGGSNSKKGKLIKPNTATNGYIKYGLWRDNKTKHCHAHRLVALAFIPNPDGLPQVAHWDGVPRNCHVSNLRWATEKENSADRVRHGRQVRGDRHPWRINPELIIRGERHKLSKLTEDDVRAIRASNESKRVLARRYDVDRALIGRVRQRKVWTHVE